MAVLCGIAGRRPEATPGPEVPVVPVGTQGAAKLKEDGSLIP
jgi:hypothetical protein